MVKSKHYNIKGEYKLMINIAWSLFQFFLAAYLLYGAIRGTYKIFTHRFIKKGKEELYKKWMRICFLLASLGLIFLGIMGILAIGRTDTDPMFMVYGNISLYVSIFTLTVLFAMFILNQAVTDRAKKNAIAQHVAPRAAFFFDDEEENAGKPTVNKSTQKKKK